MNCSRTPTSSRSLNTCFARGPAGLPPLDDGRKHFQRRLNMPTVCGVFSNPSGAGISRAQGAEDVPVGEDGTASRFSLVPVFCRRLMSAIASSSQRFIDYDGSLLFTRMHRFKMVCLTTSIPRRARAELDFRRAPQRQPIAARYSPPYGGEAPCLWKPAHHFAMREPAAIPFTAAISALRSFAMNQPFSQVPARNASGSPKRVSRSSTIPELNNYPTLNAYSQGKSMGSSASRRACCDVGMSFCCGRRCRYDQGEPAMLSESCNAVKRSNHGSRRESPVVFYLISISGTSM